MPSDAKDFIQILLNINPVERMGLNLHGDSKGSEIFHENWTDYNHLFSHKFFSPIDIEKLANDHNYQYLSRKMNSKAKK